MSAAPDDTNEALLAAMFAYFRPCGATTVDEAINYYQNHRSEIGDPGHNSSVMGLELGEDGGPKDEAELQRVFSMMHEKIGSWTIEPTTVTEDEKSTGFYACVLQKPDHGGYVAAIRGSNGQQEDWWDNVHTATESPTPQQQAAEEWMNSLPPKYTNLFLTGHSKGGNNVQYLAYENPDGRVSKAYEFDGNGLSPDYLSTHQLAPGVELRGFADRNDVVSALGVKQHEVTYIDGGGENLHSGPMWRHYPGTMLDEHGEMRAATSPGPYHQAAKMFSDLYEAACKYMPGSMKPVTMLLSAVVAIAMADDKWAATKYVLGKIIEEYILSPETILTVLGSCLMGFAWNPIGDFVEEQMNRVVDFMVDQVLSVVENLVGGEVRKVAEKIWSGVKEFGSSVCDAIGSFFSGVGSLFGFGHRKKSRPVSLNEPILVDTERLRDAADRIRAVQGRLEAAGRYVDAMRSASESSGDVVDMVTNFVEDKIASLLSGVDVGRDPALDRVATHLTETAASFDECESTLVRRVAERFAT